LEGAQGFFKKGKKGLGKTHPGRGPNNFIRGKEGQFKFFLLLKKKININKIYVFQAGGPKIIFRPLFEGAWVVLGGTLFSWISMGFIFFFNAGGFF